METATDQDLFDFDLFSFDHGPTPEELAAEQERQEAMWVSYVNEFLTVLTVFVHSSPGEEAQKKQQGASCTEAALSLSELVDTVLEILSEHVTSRVSARNTSHDDSTEVQDESDEEEEEEEEEESGNKLPPVLASLHSALPLFSMTLAGPAKPVYLSPLISTTVSPRLGALVGGEVVAAKAWDVASAEPSSTEVKVTEDREGKEGGEGGEDDGVVAVTSASDVASTVSVDGLDVGNLTDKTEVDGSKGTDVKEEEEEKEKEKERDGEKGGEEEEEEENEEKEEKEEKGEGEEASIALYTLGPADPIPLPLKLGTDIHSDRDSSVVRPRCGLMKVKVAQLLQMMISCRYPAINGAIVELGLMRRLWDLFFLHERNNTLHCAVVKATIEILEGTSVNLKHELLSETEGCNLIVKILDSFELNDARLTAGHSRLCYMGQLTACARELCQSTDDFVVSALSKVGERWENFKVATLAPLDELDRRPLGGVVPEPEVPEEQDHQMLLDNLSSILSSLRLSSASACTFDE